VKGIIILKVFWYYSRLRVCAFTQLTSFLVCNFDILIAPRTLYASPQPSRSMLPNLKPSSSAAAISIKVHVAEKTFG
jgi:hypothetical protein